MRKILILFGHRASSRTQINRDLTIDLQGIKGVTLFDVNNQYSNKEIDVKEQQELVTEHDVIVFHHPLSWYSIPAILKEWQDVVLEEGWAYGEGGNALKSKLFFDTITTGEGSGAFSVDGFYKITMRQLLVPLEKTADLCNMIYLPPYVIHSSFNITPEKVRYHKVDYQELLELLRDEKLDIDRAVKLDYLNDYLIKDNKRDKKHI